MLRCPVCREPLARQDKSYRCARGHSFDVARSGYVNLLPSGSGRLRGDDPQMLRSRRAFLEAGHYEPLLDEIVGRLTVSGAGAAPRQMVDVGCGEGYFTSGIARAFPGADVWGIDVSRVAVGMAARQHPEARFAVAAARDLPVHDGAADTIVSIFAPRYPAELHRSLMIGGRLITVGPGPMHLMEMRRILYRDVRPPGRGWVDLGSGWQLLARAELHYELQLSAQARRNLLAMTPYAWTGGFGSWRDAVAVAIVTAHFIIDEWERV